MTLAALLSILSVLSDKTCDQAATHSLIDPTLAYTITLHRQA